MSFLVTTACVISQPLALLPPCCLKLQQSETLNCDFKSFIHTILDSGNTLPTHFHGHTLDLVISYGHQYTVSSLSDLALSDHYCVSLAVFITLYQQNMSTLLKNVLLSLK